VVPFDARYDAEELAPWLMNVVEKIFAAGMVVLCLLLLARMFLRPRRRARVDATLRNSSELWGRRVRHAVADGDSRAYVRLSEQTNTNPRAITPGRFDVVRPAVESA